MKKTVLLITALFAFASSVFGQETKVLKKEAKMFETDSPISKQLFLIPAGTIVKTFEKNSSYYKVEYNGKIGYINEMYFQTDVAIKGAYPNKTLQQNTSAPDCNLNDEARRHVAKAKGYMAAAEKDEDYLNVFNEYKAALEYAPNCPDIYYNLAHCAEMLCKINSQNCDVAIYWYKKYLEINPNASDKNEIKDKIYEVEAKKEVFASKELEKKRTDALKELEKYVGKWKKNDNEDTEIFLEGGQLKIKVTQKTGFVDGEKLFGDVYQFVPISVGENFISFSYVSQIFVNSSNIFIKDKTYTYNHQISLKMVSPNRMEGVENQNGTNYNTYFVRF